MLELCMSGITLKDQLTWRSFETFATTMAGSAPAVQKHSLAGREPLSKGVDELHSSVEARGRRHVDDGMRHKGQSSCLHIASVRTQPEGLQACCAPFQVAGSG